jgi:uncharacterized OB-fold protein
MDEYQKPLPEINDENRPFWEAAQRHELIMQKCLDCAQYRYPPASICPHCLSMKAEWTRVSGRGRVYTWTVFHQVYHPAFKDEVPYNIAVVKLDEGPQLISTVVDCNNEDLYLDMPVEVVFDEVTEEVTLPRFRPTGR